MERTRQEFVYRRWKRTARDRHGRRWAEVSPFADWRSVLLFLSLCSGVLLIPLDSLSSGPPGTEAVIGRTWLGVSSFVWVSSFWLLGWVLGSLALGLFLRFQWRLVGHRPRGLVFGAAVMATGIPLFGLVLLPAWAGWLRKGPPRWLEGEEVGAGTEQGRAALAPPIGARWLLSNGWLVAYLIVGFALTSLVTNALAALAAHDPGADLLLELGKWSLRLGGIGMTTWHFHHERRKREEPRWRAWLQVPLAGLWLVPLPLVPLLALTSYFLTSPDKQDESLARAAYSAHGSASRWRDLVVALSASLPARDGLKRLAGRLPEGARLPEPGLADLQIGQLVRIKASALLVEAGLVGAWLSGRQAAWGLVLDVVVTITLFAAVCTGLVAGLLTVGRFVAAILGSTRSRHSVWVEPTLPYLAWTQIFFAGGLAAGRLFAEGQLATVGGILTALGLGGLLVQFLPNFLTILVPVPQPPATSELRKVVAVVLLGGLMTFGLVLATSEPRPGDLAGLGVALGLVSPLLSLGFVDQLFSPFTPGVVRDPRLSRRERLGFFLLLLTAVAPLGGLAIPAWFRFRSRCWPGLKRRLFGESQRDAPSPDDGRARS